MEFYSFFSPKVLKWKIPNIHKIFKRKINIMDSHVAITSFTS